jgi:hypothetical protein
MRKQAGRKQKRTDTRNTNYVAKPCPHCGSMDHSSSRSVDCPRHSSSSRKLLQNTLGNNFLTYTRKCSFDSGVRAQYRERLREKVVLLCKYTRSVIIRIQILANYYIISKEGVIPQICFTQNYFYSLGQIVQGKNVTSTNDKLPFEELKIVWQKLKDLYPSLSLPVTTSISRTSDCITGACKELETCYSSNIVTNFANRVEAYLRFMITENLPVRF